MARLPQLNDLNMRVVAEPGRVILEEATLLVESSRLPSPSTISAKPTDCSTF
jgi:hypothetical protein